MTAPPVRPLRAHAPVHHVSSKERQEFCALVGMKGKGDGTPQAPTTESHLFRSAACLKLRAYTRQFTACWAKRVETCDGGSKTSKKRRSLIEGQNKSSRASITC